MSKFKVLNINSSIVNEYLYFKNLNINRKYSANKKKIKKIDHYLWWLQEQKVRKSFLILKENKPIFISTGDYFKYKHYKFIYSGLISCLPETNLFDLLKAIKIQNIYLNKQKNKYCIITIDRQNKVLMHHWKYFGYFPLEKKNIIYKYVKKFIDIGKNFSAYYKKI